MVRLSWLPLPLAAALLFTAPAAEALAQVWPNGPVKMLVGFAAGGSTDIITRDVALNDMLAGHVPLSVLSVLQALPQLESRSVKPLAVTSAKATGMLPDVPALAEAGLKDCEAELWYVVIAPAGLPPALADRINEDLVKIVTSPGMRNKLAAQGARPVGSTQAEAAAFMKSESEKWGKIVREANIKGE